MTDEKQNEKTLERRIAKCRWLKGKIKNLEEVTDLHIDKEHKTAFWLGKTRITNSTYDMVCAYRYSKNKKRYGLISGGIIEYVKNDEKIYPRFDKAVVYRNKFLIPTSNGGTYYTDFKHKAKMSFSTDGTDAGKVAYCDQLVKEIVKGEKESKNGAFYKRFSYDFGKRKGDEKRANRVLEKVAKYGINTTQASYAYGKSNGGYMGDHYVPSQTYRYCTSPGMYKLSTKYGDIYVQMKENSKDPQSVSFAYQNNLQKYGIFKALLKKENIK